MPAYLLGSDCWAVLLMLGGRTYVETPYPDRRLFGALVCPPSQDEKNQHVYPFLVPDHV